MTAGDVLAVHRFQLWGTTGVLCVTDATALVPATRILEEATAAVELAANRFRPDGELVALNAAAGRGPFRASDTLLDLVDAALRASSETDGACDPTVLPALLALGYGSDIEAIRGRDVDRAAADSPSPGSAAVTVDLASRTIELAAGCALDLGAIAKARCADVAATLVEARLSVGCLVGLGGDLRASGHPPADGWAVAVSPAASDPFSAAAQQVAITSGGIATSSTRLRRWRVDGSWVHHIVDPRTGASADDVWALVTVAAPSCASANALSTAAVVWGDDALFELPQRGVAARLERRDGTVEYVGGWPDLERAA